MGIMKRYNGVEKRHIPKKIQELKKILEKYAKKR